jgi:thiamine monophosphate kinase
MDHPEPTGIHGIDLSAWKHYGRWSAAVVANDVIAMGARPHGISFDLGLKGWDDEMLRDWLRGVLEVCSAYGMVYEGGNVNRVCGTVCGMAWGVPIIKPLSRRGARAGDRIIVTAEIGTGWALRLLHENGVFAALPDVYAEYKHWPTINFDAFQQVFAGGFVHSAMDLTDGLWEFGHEIVEQDGLSVVLHAPSAWSAPVKACASALSIPTDAFLLDLGYDTPYAHAWTVAAEDVDEVLQLLGDSGVQCSLVGSVENAEIHPTVYLRLENGDVIEAPAIADDVLDGRGSVLKWSETVVDTISRHSH